MTQTIRPQRLTIRLALASLLVLASTFSRTGVRAAPAESLVVTGNADTVANDGVCTLREAITNANDDMRSGSLDCVAGLGADTITFAGNYTITLTSALPAITSTLTIDGSGHSVTVSGNNAVRVFSIQPGASVTLNQLSIINGATDLGGGILNNAGALAISHSTVSGNLATTLGGGILNFGGVLTVSHSTISGNSVTAAGGGGGGLATSGGTLTVDDSTFSNNSAPTSAGGGLAILDGTAIVSTTTFSGNSAAGGGGVYMSTGSTLTVNGSAFNTNSATDSSSGGGGIANNFGALTVNTSTFNGNSAASGNGGGIMCWGTLLDFCTVSISHSTLSGNSATRGGGLYSMYGALTISHSTFSGNSSTTDGGGIYNLIGTQAISHSTFNGNSAAVDGGGIFNVGNASNDTTLTIGQSTFSSNSATTGSGGGLYSIGETLTIGNSTFGGNSAIDGGGLASSGETLTVTHSTFSDNSASSFGGGINNHLSALSLRNSLIANSIAGGDCYNDNGIIAANVNNLIEDGSCSPALSGDPLLRPLGSYSGSTQTFALLPGSPAIDTANTAACLATDQRGVARPQGAACDIGAYESNEQPGPNFVVNLGDDSDDGMCDGYVAGQLDCTLREAITAANSRAGADTITFAGNYPITLASTLPQLTGNLTVDGSGHNISVSGNHSIGVFYIQFGAVVTMSRLSIISGTADYGGGLYNYGALTVDHSTFSGNAATINGGGLHNRGTLTVSHSTFNNNSAANFGGGVNNTSTGAATVINSTFSGNAANLRGGGSYNEGTLTVNHSTFSGNAANNNGGGIYNNTSSTLHLRHSLLANSSAGTDCGNGGILATNVNNLIEDGTCSPALSGDPLLSPLGSYGGSTRTFALLPGSPAIDAAGDCTPFLNPDEDQRSVARPQGSACDIGSYESRGFALTKIGGDNQSILVQTAFPHPLVISVTSATSEPVNGGQVILTAPASGASLAATPITLTIANGAVSTTVTANNAVGPYSVIASARGAANTAFNLTNLTQVYLPVICRNFVAASDWIVPTFTAERSTFRPSSGIGARH